MTRFQSRILRICTRTWHQRMTSWQQSTPASDLWTVALSSQTQLYPAPLSTHMWTSRLHTQTASIVAIGPPFRPTSLHSSGPVCLLETNLETGPWRSWKQTRGHWAENSRVMGTKAMILKEWCRFYVGMWGKHAWTKARKDIKYAALQSGKCRNDCPRNFLMSPNAPKETGGKIKVYTPPKQRALDLLWIQKISITSTSQKIIQERGHKSFWQKNSNNCK